MCGLERKMFKTFAKVLQTWFTQFLLSVLRYSEETQSLMAPSSWEIERIPCHLLETQAVVKSKVIIATHLFHSQLRDCREEYNMEFSQRRTLLEL